jgi:hypothetical protein
MTILLEVLITLKSYIDKSISEMQIRDEILGAAVAVIVVWLLVLIFKLTSSFNLLTIIKRAAGLL